MQRRLLIPLAMCITLCALAIGRLAYGFLLPAMRAELGLSVSQAGNLGTASSLGYLALVLPAGYLASRYGPRSSMLFGLLLITLSCAAMAIVSGYLVYLLLMIAMGFGTALLYTPLIALLVGWFPNRRGTVIGVANSGIGIGIFVVGLLVPRIIESQGDEGYRTVWALFAAFAALILMMVCWLVKNPPSLTGAMRGHSIETANRKESRRMVLQNTAIRSLALIYGVLGVSYIVLSVFTYSYALESGIDPVRAGAMASVSGFLSIFAGSIWGGVSDFIGRAGTLMLCFALVCTATVLPVVLPTDVGFSIHYVTTGLVLGGLFTVILAATSERVDFALVPIAVSVVTVVFAIGQLLGPALAGQLIEQSGQYGVAFAGSGVLMAVGVMLSYRLWRLERIVPRSMTVAK